MKKNVTGNNSAILSTDCEIVYFDLETSGLEGTADILQIAATCKQKIFNIYINPIQVISKSATKITGLSAIAGQLYLHDQVLETFSIDEALISFRQFLSLFKKKCILVAHNARFDVPKLLRAIIDNSMINEFSVIVGFADSLALFKKVLPERKGPGKFKLITLAHDFLENERSERWHDAEFDIVVLEKLVCTISKEENLFGITKTFNQYLVDIENTQKVNVGLHYLTELKETLSKHMLQKIAKQNITFETLKAIYRNGGEEETVKFLMQKDEQNRLKITKDKRIHQKIIDCLKRHVIDAS